MHPAFGLTKIADCVVTHEAWGMVRTIVCVDSVAFVYIIMMLINKTVK